jgi:hypothetical protein
MNKALKSHAAQGTQDLKKHHNVSTENHRMAVLKISYKLSPMTVLGRGTNEMPRDAQSIWNYHEITKYMV